MDTVKKMLLFIFGVILFSSCVPYKRPPAVYLPQGEVTVTDLLEIIDTTWVSSFKAAIKVSLYSDGIHRGTFRGRLFYKREAGLRAMLFGPFATVIADTVIKDSTVGVFLPSKGVLYKMVLPVDYILPDKKDILKGRISLKKDRNTLELITASRAANIYRVYVFNKNSLNWKALRVYSEGRKLFEIWIRRHKRGIPLDFSLIYHGLRINVKLEGLQLNTVVPKDLFRLPEGLRQESLSGLIK